MTPSDKRPNLPSRTGGGKQLWTDVFLYGDWRIRAALTGHHRLLDDQNTRRAGATSTPVAACLKSCAESWHYRRSATRS